MRSIMNDKANRRARTLNDAVGQESSSAALLPIMGAIFIAFLVIGMAMPVLPLHVHQSLELSTFVVGLVAGTQFGAAILSARMGRPLRGCERREARRHRRPSDRGYERARLPRVAALRCQPHALRDHSTARPRAARCRRKLHHHGRPELGTGPSWPWKHQQGSRLGRQRDVCRLCGRRAGRSRALRRLRLCGGCARDHAASACDARAGRSASAAFRPLRMCALGS